MSLDYYAETRDRIASVSGQILDWVIMGKDGTISYNGSDLPTTGYFVGGKYPSLVWSDPSEWHLNKVRSFVANSPCVEYYGVWTDSESGVVYIDGVDHYESLEEALAYAVDRGEIAIWDIANTDEIRLEGLKEI